MSQIKFEPLQISSFGDEALAALDASFRSKEVFEIGGKLFSLSGVSHHWTGAEIGRVSAVADHVSVPANPAWTGEGLPPVGTVCTIECEAPHKRWKKHVGQQVLIIAHSTGYEGNPTAVYKVFDAEDSEYHALREQAFRPIRTPEQIAAQARSKACDEMFGIMSSPPVREGNRSDMAEALYDAGYRKFEIVEE